MRMLSARKNSGYGEGESKIMMSKPRLPRDIQMQCLWIVRGYERNRQEYKRLRREILDASGSPDGPHGTDIGRPTERRQMRLDALENTLLAKQIHAVEHASARIGDNLPDSMRDQLREAILTNCQDGRKYPYEHLFLIGISRTDFYRYRSVFFMSIATELELFVRKKS